MKHSLLLLIILLTACAPMTLSPTPVPATPKAIRYLALGDSYTIGESVSLGQRWPVQLADLLKQKGHPTAVDIIARTGWTTNELWDAIRQAPPQEHYDLVSLLIGVNDEYRSGTAEHYREDFRFLLGRAIRYAGDNPKHVIVLSIPDWGVTPYAVRDSRPAAQISAEIAAFNTVNKDEAQKAGVHYVDITPISRKYINDLTLLANDGLHPSGKMYAEWATLTLPEALSAITNP